MSTEKRRIFDGAVAMRGVQHLLDGPGGAEIPALIVSCVVRTSASAAKVLRALCTSFRDATDREICAVTASLDEALTSLQKAAAISCALPTEHEDQAWREAAASDGVVDLTRRVPTPFARQLLVRCCASASSRAPAHGLVDSDTVDVCRGSEDGSARLFDSRPNTIHSLLGRASFELTNERGDPCAFAKECVALHQCLRERAKEYLDFRLYCTGAEGTRALEDRVPFLRLARDVFGEARAQKVQHWLEATLRTLTSRVSSQIALDLTLPLRCMAHAKPRGTCSDADCWWDPRGATRIDTTTVHFYLAMAGAGPRGAVGTVDGRMSCQICGVRTKFGRCRELVTELQRHVSCGLLPTPERDSHPELQIVATGRCAPGSGHPLSDRPMRTQLMVVHPSCLVRQCCEIGPTSKATIPNFPGVLDWRSDLYASTRIAHALDRLCGSGTSKLRTHYAAQVRDESIVANLCTGKAVTLFEEVARRARAAAPATLGTPQFVLVEDFPGLMRDATTTVQRGLLGAGSERDAERAAATLCVELEERVRAVEARRVEARAALAAQFDELFRQRLDGDARRADALMQFLPSLSELRTSVVDQVECLYDGDPERMLGASVAATLATNLPLQLLLLDGATTRVETLRAHDYAMTGTGTSASSHAYEFVTGLWCARAVRTPNDLEEAYEFMSGAFLFAQYELDLSIWQRVVCAMHLFDAIGSGRGETHVGVRQRVVQALLSSSRDRSRKVPLHTLEWYVALDDSGDHVTLPVTLDLCSEKLEWIRSAATRLLARTGATTPLVDWPSLEAEDVARLACEKDGVYEHGVWRPEHCERTRRCLEEAVAWLTAIVDRLSRHRATRALAFAMITNGDPLQLYGVDASSSLDTEALIEIGRWRRAESEGDGRGEA